MKKVLLVIIPDRLSDLVAKGEITERYYNPGNLFEEVHILMTNDDKVDPAAVQKTVGSAKLYLHNLPAKGIFLRSLGWRPWLLKGWAEPAVALAREIRPSLIRCHGCHLNAYLAFRIKKILGIPYVISLHGNPDVDYYRGRLARTCKEKLFGWAIEDIEVISVRNANFVLPVYSPIVSYLKKHGVKNYEVVYNVVGYGCVPKKDYTIDKTKVKVLCVGRQQSMQKDPSFIIDAIAELPNVFLLLIGDGDLHDSLVERAIQKGASERIKFIRSMENINVLKEMANSDIYIYSSINYEISKTCIEAALTGMPIILNDRDGKPARELVGEHMLLVANNKESYKQALEKVIYDDAYREMLGRKAYAYAQENWAPAKMEARVVEIYKEVMEKAGYKNFH